MLDCLPIAEVRRDIACQPREALNTDVVETYADAMRAGAEFPPVVVFTDKSNVHWLADGYHRISAAESAGRSEIAVEQRFGERRLAILYSLGANSTHGLRRSNEDKRRAVDKMLADKEWGTWSDSRIAEHCGVSDMLVRDRRKAAVKAGSRILNLKRQGKDGKSYPAQRKPTSRSSEYAQDMPPDDEPVRQVEADYTELPPATSLHQAEEAVSAPQSREGAAASTADGPPVTDDREGGEAVVTHSLPAAERAVERDVAPDRGRTGAIPPREGLIGFWIDPDDPMSVFVAAHQMLAGVSKELTGEEAAERWPANVPLVNDDATRAADVLDAFERACRKLYPEGGNVAALKGEEAA